MLKYCLAESSAFFSPVVTEEPPVVGGCVSLPGLGSVSLGGAVVAVVEGSVSLGGAVVVAGGSVSFGGAVVAVVEGSVSFAGVVVAVVEDSVVSVFAGEEVSLLAVVSDSFWIPSTVDVSVSVVPLEPSKELVGVLHAVRIKHSHTETRIANAFFFIHIPLSLFEFLCYPGFEVCIIAGNGLYTYYT